jgi:putative ABC transport system ATP-binding protein
MSEFVAELVDLHRLYNAGKDNEVRAVDGVSLQIKKREFLAIAGPSGSGKSTILNCLGCLDTPSSGEVWVDGERVSDRSLSALSETRSRKIGFIFQSFNLIPVLTAFENVAFSLDIQGDLGRVEIRERVMNLLERLGISAEAHRRPGELSGGQQQRVAIARALIKNPALILADEPTANLDSATSDNIIDLMRQMRDELDATFVFSTHNTVLMGRAERLVKLVDGQIVSDNIQEVIG